MEIKNANIQYYKRKKIYTALLPLIILFWLVVLWGIFGFLSTTGGLDDYFQEFLSRVIPFLVGLCVVMMPSAIFAALYFNRKERQEEWTTYDHHSGCGENSIIPDEIKQWNWGAAFLSLFWGPYFGVWRSFWMMVPLVNLVYFFILGFEGNELAWRESKWKSIDDFQKIMRRWNITALVLVGVAIFLKLASL